jgi:hypothetical protein
MTTFIDAVGSYDSCVTIMLTDHSPKYQPDSRLPSDGHIRTNYGRFEYWDGKSQCWVPFSGSDINVGLGPRLTHIVNWAEQKMDEERQLVKLLADNPSLRTAKENYDLIRAIVDQDA